MPQMLNAKVKGCLRWPVVRGHWQRQMLGVV